MVQDNKSTQPVRCLGMLCGTSYVLCARKTVANYLANAAFYLANDRRTGKRYFEMAAYCEWTAPQTPTACLT